MKKHLLLLALTGIVSFLLVGCDGSQSTAQQTVARKSVASSGTATSRSRDKVVRATLIVTPGGVSTCKKGAHVDPEVTWQRIDATVKNTKVTVSAPGSSDEKLFATGGFGGSAKAGDWVVPGVTFHLYDADTGIALASYTEAALPCTN